jgi:DNA-binding transcriptional MerR regulator
MTTKPKGYINKEVAAISGANPKTLAYYSDSGMVLPTISKGKGKGSRRLYSPGDVLKFMLIPVLSEHGLSLDQIKRVFKLLRRDLFSPSNPFLHHGMPHERGFLGVYNLTDDDFTAQVVFLPDPEACDPSVKKQFEDNLETFTVDLLNHKSVLVVEITEYIRRLETRAADTGGPA